VSLASAGPTVSSAMLFTLIVGVAAIFRMASQDALSARRL
jgi:hypothetical protein